MKKQAQKGAGSIVVIVLVMLFVIATITIGRSFFTSFVADKTSKSVHGDISYILARNILKEGRQTLQILANSKALQPSLFDKFHNKNTKFTESLSLKTLPFSQKLLLQYPGYEILDNNIIINGISKYPASKILPFFHDSFGLVELNVTVRHLQSGISRNAKEIFGYRNTLTAAPIPLSNYTLLIADGVFLVNCGGVDNDANKTIDAANSRIKELYTKLQEFIDKGNELKTYLDDKAGSSNPLVSAKYEKATNEVQKSINIFSKTNQKKPTIIVKDFGEATETDKQTLHYFAKAPMCFYSREPQFDLSQINLPDQLKKRLKTLDDKEKKLTL